MKGLYVPAASFATDATKMTASAAGTAQVPSAMRGHHERCPSAASTRLASSGVASTQPSANTSSVSWSAAAQNVSLGSGACTTSAFKKPRAYANESERKNTQANITTPST